jgi:hypothetical protein
MEIKVTQVTDDVLTLARVEKGPKSAEARVLAKLRLLRAKNRQVFAYRIGRYLIAAPVPDALNELAMIACAQLAE